MKRIVAAILLVGAVGVGAGAYYANRGGTQPTLSTTPVSRGSIVSAVSATGTLQALTTVQVGTQVSGTVTWLGADFNSRVTKGQVIARLDPSLFEAQVQQAAATASRAAADVDNARVQLTDAEQKFTRSQELAAKQLVSRSDYDAAKTAVDAAQAQVRSVQAQLVQAQASLDQARVNREHAVITAPIDGIVIQRSVDIGQTVAASLQSPTIFQIAADLTKMQVNASIDESDIGRTTPGQKVTFRVDAYPDKTFTGTLTQVRLQPTVVQNVTTYSAIIDVPNPDLELKPGMTATVTVEIARRDDVLRVANAALRFSPTAETLAAFGQDASASAPVAPQRDSAKAGSRGQKRVWTFSDGLLHSTPVTVGLSDGQFTEITGGALEPGASVVTNVSSATQPTRTASSNMFMPGGGFGSPPMGGGRQGGGAGGLR
jgi:HlyD family secretion protein